MTEWTIGQPCRVVEHDEATMQPLEGGRSIPARVERVEGAYVLVAEEGATGLGRFWAESGWWAWDGQLRWRLLPGDGTDAATAAGREASDGD